MIRFEHKGDFSKTARYLQQMKKMDLRRILDKYGQKGVDALSSATPMDSGLTANAWSYSVDLKNGSIALNFNNSNVQDGVPIAIIIQYGHGTGTGGWVEGRDYINPAIQPIFDEITDELWREVTRL